MKILLLNDNPVVNKLVTLSAQKTSDELDAVSSLDEAKHNHYDLLVLDDTVYNQELLDEIANKITYSKSLFIYSKTSKEVAGFTSTLKKPFLPTDLVERFSIMAKEINQSEPELVEEELDTLEDIDLDELSLDDNLEGDDIDSDLSLDELALDDDLDLEDIDTTILDSSLDDILDEEIEEETPTVLDEDDLQEVKDLLEDTEETLPALEEDDKLESLDLEEELSDIVEDESLDDLESSNSNDMVLDEEELQEVKDLLEETEEVLPDLEEETPEEEVEEELEIEEETPEEEVEEELEIEEETLEELPIDVLDSLNSRDIKMAVGEEVEELSEVKEVQNTPEVEMLEEVEEIDKNVQDLKNLLTALSDKNVAASLKGMKISVNITIGGD